MSISILLKESICFQLTLKLEINAGQSGITANHFVLELCHFAFNSSILIVLLLERNIKKDKSIKSIISINLEKYFYDLFVFDF